MSLRYTASASATNTANTTVGELRSTTAIRPRINHVILSASGTPQDYQAEYTLNRTTTAGTGGNAITPQALDPNDPAATATFTEDHTGEPTYTAGAVLLRLGHNFRATVQWMAQPGYELILPAAANGVGLRATAVSTAYTSVFHCFFEE